MRRPWPLMIVLTVAAVASGCGGTDAEPVQDEAKRNAWMKKGYTEYTGDGSESEGLAYKWDNSVCDPDPYSGCWGMRVVTRDGCEHLYVELGVTDWDSEGNAVEGDDFTNATAKNLAPGEVALLDFTSVDYSQAVLDHMSCY